MLFLKKLRPFDYLLIVVPLGLTFIFGIFGADYSDQGFVRSFSWRIRLGEIPYIDFIYPRPPVSIYLDYLFKILSPLKLEVFLERLRFYYQMLLVTWLILKASKVLDHAHGKTIFWILYSFTLGCFPPMSWYTTDGILFSSLAFLFVEKTDWKFGIAVALSFLSALCKQSFYPVALFILLYYFFNLRRISVHAIWGIIFIPVTFCLYLFYFGSGDDFLRQSSSATQLKDILKSGFFLYLESRSFRYLFFLALGFYLWRKKPVWGNTFFVIALGFDYFKFLWETGSSVQSNPATGWPRALFGASFLYLVYKLKEQQMFKYWFLLCIAWCTSLSWGYQTPILFISGLAVIIIRGVDEFFPYFITRRRTLILLGFSLILYFVQNLNRHLQGRIWDQNYHLGKLSPSYQLIFTNQGTFSLYQEVSELGKGGAHFLPAISDADYFLRREPILPLNWISDVEVRSDAQKLLHVLSDCRYSFYVNNGDLHPKAYSLSWPIISTFASGSGVFKKVKREQCD
jgi:hypothetical protein